MTWRKAVLLLSLCVVGGCFGAYSRTETYWEQVLVKCSGLQRDVLEALLESDGVDVWRVGAAGGSVEFRVSAEQFQRMKGDLPECEEAGNVEELLREMERQTLNRTEQEWFEEYHQYSEIVMWYEEIAGAFPQLTKFIPSIGKSLEGRDMPALHITATEGGEEVNKIYFQCQIHAREWISGATCMYLVNYLLENYEKEERVTNLLKSVEFIFIVFMNPDGYEYTWTVDRLWRKNRRIIEGSSCIGVDLNRNYPFKWEDGSTNPCSETYRGSGPASEPEVKNSVDYFTANMPIVGAIDWHSYSQLILRPWGWTSDDAPDEGRLREVGDGMSAAIFEVNGQRYVSQKGIGLYPTSGTARDWFYSEEANELNEHRSAGYTMELRDTGQFGFLLPPEQIIPTGEEMVPAVLFFAETLNDNPIPKS